MRVLITGATGMIGTALSGALERRGDEPVALGRGTGEAGPTWSVQDRRIDDDALEGIDAVVHLAGRPIEPPFTDSKRAEIMESRRVGTQLIAEAVAEAKPRVLVSASAIGYYGDRGDTELTEDAEPGEGFLAEVVKVWESATRPAEAAGVRTVHIRTGLVLSSEGGLLPRLSLPFKLGLGGPLGGGRQWWSWITLEDEVRAILRCLDDEALSGPVNLASPNPVRNVEFTKTLGRVLNRPAVIPVPAFALRLALGSAADELVLASQRVVPAKLSEAGFEFHHPDLEPGLRHVLGR